MSEINRRLLVIDDDAVTRQIIAAYLAKSGFQVHEEACGESGIAWFREHRPDLVLTDLCMPDVNGLTILSMVKSVDRHIPVIVISGMGMVNDVAEALRLGAADYLVKPLVDLDVLLHSIKKALEVLDLQKQNTRYRQELESVNRNLRESVRILERDQQAGRQVQSNMLPPTPLCLGRAVVSHKIIPSLFLSGDFVDYGLINERYLSFYLTDVSGHGAAPAFVTVWLKQLVRRLIREKRLFHRDTGHSDESFEINTAEWTRIVNQEVIHSKFDCHLTCFTGVLDLQTRKIRYVLGGHLPLPVMLVNGKASFLEGKGKPLGIFKDAKWEVYESILPGGASLVVFSDGVLEILPPKDLIGKEQHLLELLKDTQGDLDTVCSSLKLDQLTNAPDDIAVLTIKLESE